MVTPRTHVQKRPAGLNIQLEIDQIDLSIDSSKGRPDIESSPSLSFTAPLDFPALRLKSQKKSVDPVSKNHQAETSVIQDEFERQ